MKLHQGTPGWTSSGERRNDFYNALDSEAKGVTGKTYKELYFDMHLAFPQATEMELASTANGMLIIGNARAHGKRFVFSDRLVEALKATETPKQVPEIRLPFKALIINEWCIVEDDDKVMRGCRFYGDGKIDFIRFNHEEGYDLVREKYGEIINMLLYLTSEKADVEHEVYRGKMLKKIQSGQARAVVYVGRNYRMRGDYDKTNRVVTARFIVRGHWRNTPTKHGYKRIFIEPYWKGSDMSEVIEKTYMVV